jgi:hypothetical protein
MNNWPTQLEVLSGKSVYGNPKGQNITRMSVSWERLNIVTIVPPFRMTYASTPIKRIRIHKQCAASLARVLDNLKAAAGGKQETLDHWGVSIFGGVVAYRLMRGGSRLSIHSYGAAIDLDPARNGLGDQTPRFANFPQVLKAFADEGWTWGGKWSRADGMHWQATK